MVLNIFVDDEKKHDSANQSRYIPQMVETYGYNTYGTSYIINFVCKERQIYHHPSDINNNQMYQILPNLFRVIKFWPYIISTYNEEYRYSDSGDTMCNNPSPEFSVIEQRLHMYGDDQYAKEYFEIIEPYVTIHG